MKLNQISRFTRALLLSVQCSFLSLEIFHLLGWEIEKFHKREKVISKSMNRKLSARRSRDFHSFFDWDSPLFFTPSEKHARRTQNRKITKATRFCQQLVSSPSVRIARQATRIFNAVRWFKCFTVTRSENHTKQFEWGATWKLNKIQFSWFGKCQPWRDVRDFTSLLQNKLCEQAKDFVQKKRVKIENWYGLRSVYHVCYGAALFLCMHTRKEPAFKCSSTRVIYGLFDTMFRGFTRTK